MSRPDDLPRGAEARRELFGGYAIAEWHPVSVFTLSAGIRLNVAFEERGEGGAEAAGQEDEGQTHLRRSGQVGVLYVLWEEGFNHARLFANYRNTFKPAAFDFGLGEAAARRTRCSSRRRHKATKAD